MDPNQPNRWKIWTLDILAVLFAGATGYSCLLYFSGAISFWLLVFLSCVFLLTCLFDFLLSRDPRRRALTSLLQITAFIAFFYSVQGGSLISAAIVLSLFYLFGDRSATTILENSLKFRIGVVSAAYLKKVFLGFTLAITILYVPLWNAGTAFISNQRFEEWYNSVAKGMSHVYSGINLRTSVGGFAESIARLQLKTDPRFQALPEKGQEQAIKMAASQLVNDASQSTKTSLDPNMSLSSAFYLYFSNLLKNFQTQFGDSFMVAWGVALFLIIWSVGMIFVQVVIFGAYLVYELMMALNFVKIVGETRTKEVLELT